MSDEGDNFLESTMRMHPCEPCVKRKVGCNRQQPCTNCKRRKDTCTYLEISPWERIKELEALIRQLRGSKPADQGAELDQPPRPGGSDNTYPENSSGPRRTTLKRHQGGLQVPSDLSSRSFEEHSTLPSHPRPSKANKRQGNDPALAEEDGENVYLESGAWFAWNGKSIKDVQRPPEKLSSSSLSDTGALLSVLIPDVSIDFAQKHPTPQEAATLWFIFNQNVDLLFKISFESEMKKLRAEATSQSFVFFYHEHAFIFAIYLITVLSISDDECWQQLNRPRSELISQYQMLCEQALARSDFLGASNITILRALTLYIAAGSRRLSNKHLWGLMGVAIRSAERMGLHRDGTFLGLSPFETERRRRLWWQLQQLDVSLAIWAGSPSLTLQADWDTRLPLNIEDSDLDRDAKDFPKEREGLTSMSYCLWRYWLLNEQRSSCRPDGSPVGFAWASDKSLSHDSKQALIDRLEAGLKAKFLQHCDPIRPRDLLIQLTARACICTFRLLTLHPLAYNGTAESRNELLDTSIKCLEYDVAVQSADSLKCFGLRTKGFFQWPAFIHVLSEATQQTSSSPKAIKTWKLLIDVYGANPNLSDLMDDPRKLYAAELMITAWKSRERSFGCRHYGDKPAPLAQLQMRLAKAKERSEQPAQTRSQQSEAVAIELSVAQTMDDSVVKDIDMGDVGELSFDDIDWSFWLGFENGG